MLFIPTQVCMGPPFQCCKTTSRHVGRGWSLFSKLQTRQLSFDRWARGISTAGLNCSGPSAPFCAGAMKSCVMTTVDKVFNESHSWQWQNFKPSSFFFSSACHQKVQKRFWHNLLHWQINGFDVRVGNFHLAEQNLAMVVVSRDQEPCLSLLLCLVSHTGTSVFRGAFFCTGQGPKAEPELVHKLLVCSAPCPRAGLASHRSNNWLIPSNWQAGLFLGHHYFFWTYPVIYQDFHFSLCSSVIHSATFTMPAEGKHCFLIRD